MCILSVFKMSKQGHSEDGFYIRSHLSLKTDFIMRLFIASCVQNGLVKNRKPVFIPAADKENQIRSERKSALARQQKKVKVFGSVQVLGFDSE